MKKTKAKQSKSKKMDLEKAVNESMKEKFPEHSHASDEECDCQCHGCDCCACDCGPSCECDSECKSENACGSCECETAKPSPEQLEQSLTDAASDVWMKLFLQACEKEWKKVSAKEIQKLAVEHVKRSKAQWKQKMKK